MLLAFSLRAASSLSFGRGDKAAESGDVDYEYHHIIKGLYATFSSWHIDPCRLMFVADGTFPPATAYCFLKVGNAPLSS